MSLAAEPPLVMVSKTGAAVSSARRAAGRHGAPFAMAALAGALAAGLIFSIMLGRYSIAPGALFHLLWAKVTGAAAPEGLRVEAAVLFQTRLPRVFSAALVGGALAASGAAFQSIFKNPMVSPDLLGASAGASLGVALGILLGLNFAVIQGLAFALGLAAVGATCVISAGVSRRNESVLVMVLTGILTHSICTAEVSMVKLMADPYSKLPVITFWLMGSLGAVGPRDLMMALPPLVIGFAPLMLLRWRLNVLALGDEEARALGVEAGRLRLLVVACATLMTAATVSIAGLVGWAGLVVPHLARMIVGPDNKRLMPASALLGALFLLLVDDLARGAAATEIPLSILTALTGAPFFIFLMMNSKRGWA